MSKNFTNDTEQKIKDYYNNLKLSTKTRHELEIINQNLCRLKKIKSECQSINFNRKKLEELQIKIDDNYEKLIDKELKIAQILEMNSELEYIISKILDEEDRRIIELRIKNNETFDELIDIFHMSKSTICRKFNRIIKNIGEKLEGELRA